VDAEAEVLGEEGVFCADVVVKGRTILVGQALAAATGWVEGGGAAANGCVRLEAEEVLEVGDVAE
jgi:hypothetical protein